MSDLDDLTTPLTKDEVKASIYEALATVGVDTTAWKAGSVVRTIIAIVAILVAALSRLVSLVASGGFLELSSGTWKTVVARFVYAVDRISATFATGFVTLVNASGNIYDLDPGDLVVSNSATGKSYRNSEHITLNGTSTLTDVAVEAVESGSASTSPPGYIDSLETTLLGVTVTNPAAVVGLDEESDAALEVRCKEKLGSLSPMGPWDAYAYAVRNAKNSSGASLGIVRTRNNKDGFGNVTVYVATASGGVSGTVGDTTTDLGAADDAVQRNAAPLTVTATTVSATPKVVAVTYQAWCYNTSGLTDDQVKDAIAEALSVYMSAQPIGGNIISTDPGKVFTDAIRSCIAGALPQIFHVVLVVPSSDTEFGLDEVPVLGTILGTVTQVASAEGGF
jgi:phage-related baseplate assembly protein